MDTNNRFERDIDRDEQKGKLDSIIAVPGLQYHRELSVNGHGKFVGSELLVYSSGYKVEAILSHIKKQGNTLYLMQRGLIEAFDLISKGEKGKVSFNAYVQDIGNKDFRHIVKETMEGSDTGDRGNIEMEIVETPDGEIDGKFIENIKWFLRQGFRLALDDFDVFGGAKNNMSRLLFLAIGGFMHSFKIDWQDTRTLITDPSSRASLQLIQNRFPLASITFEGIRSMSDMKALQDLGHVFQVSSYGMDHKKSSDN